MKALFWRCLAWFLSAGASAIRRRPSGSGPDAWRAVEFSFSHFGEDLVVLRLLGCGCAEKAGYFVDVGAFDPILRSNTYLLYLYGWRGINIDASPERLARFAAVRPGDTKVATAVSDASRDMLFLAYPTVGTSRLVEPDDPVRTNALGEEPITITPCRTQTLTEVLHRHCPATQIDFLNVDCEGLDLAVLRGLDWSRWTPRVVAVEANTPAERERLVGYLTERGYRLVSMHVVTLIFLHESGRAALPIGVWPSDVQDGSG